jgi:VanZ family protein
MMAWLRQDLRHPIFWPVLGLLMLLAILWVCLIPMPAAPITLANGDKYEHFLTFAFLAHYFGQLLRQKSPPWSLAAWLIAYGGLIEIAQSFTAYRSADWFDLLADSLGVFAGLWFLRRIVSSAWVADIDRRI